MAQLKLKGIISSCAPFRRKWLLKKLSNLCGNICRNGDIGHAESLKVLTCPNLWNTRYCSVVGLCPTCPSFQFLNCWAKYKKMLHIIFKPFQANMDKTGCSSSSVSRSCLYFLWRCIHKGVGGKELNTPNNVKKHWRKRGDRIKVLHENAKQTKGFIYLPCLWNNP